MKLPRHILTAGALLCYLQAAALPASHFATASRLAEGRWVKIKVTQTGIQRLTAEQLSRWGFSDPANVRVYGYSGVELADATFSTETPDDLPMQYSAVIDNSLYFYGEADYRVTVSDIRNIETVRNYYAPYSVYFLSDSETDSPTADEVSYKASENSSRTEHIAFDYQEREQWCPAEGASYYFSNKITSADSPEGKYSFSVFDAVQNPDASANPFYFYLLYQPAWRATNTVASKLKLVPGVPTSYRRGSDESFAYNFGYDPEISGQVIMSQMPKRSYVTVAPFDWSDNLTLPVSFYSSDSGLEWMAMNYAAMLYRRHNRLGTHGQLQMQFQNLNGANVAIDGLTPTSRVWDVTSALSVRPMAIGDDNAVSPDEAYGARIVAFDPASDNGFFTPEYIGEAPNSNLHGDSAPIDMLIVAPEAYITQAREIAALHKKHQGLRVKVVSPETVYNEFSSGAQSAIGLRRYVKMLYDRNPESFRYLFLFGLGSWDNRHLILSDNNYIVTYQATDNPGSSFAPYYTMDPRAFMADTFFGMLSDDFTTADIWRTKVDIAVGRYPVSTTDEADAAVVKFRDHLENYYKTDDFSRTILLAGHGDANQHVDMSEEAGRRLTSGSLGMELNKTFTAMFSPMNEADRLGTVSRFFTRGAGLGIFAGHGSYESIGPPSLMTSTSVSNINFGNHPMIFMATCHVLSLSSTTPTIGNTMLLHDSGPIGVISAGRQVYLSHNRQLYYAFTDEYAANRGSEYIGDIWRRSFNRIMESTSQTITSAAEGLGINTLNYNLGADPAMPIHAPQYTMAVTSLNGEAATGGPKPIKAYQTITLEGTVNDPATGDVIEDYTGTARVTVYDGLSQAPTLAPGNDDTPDRTFDIEQDILASASARITDGHWRVSLTLPKPAIGSPVKGNLAIITATASTADGGSACTTWRGISVGTDGNKPSDDTTGPEITEFYVNNPSFSDGDGVASPAVVYATIAPDPSGLYLSLGNLGNRPRLIVDETNSITDMQGAFVFNIDGSATLRVPLSGISEGYHTASLTVSDNLGNFSTRRIAFNLTNSGLTGKLTADDDIVTSNATITFTSNSGAEVARLIIEDINGKTIESTANPNFPFIWRPDETLPDGRYRVRALLKKENDRGVTPDLELILLRH